MEARREPITNGCDPETGYAERAIRNGLRRTGNSLPGTGYRKRATGNGNKLQGSDHGKLDKGVDIDDQLAMR